MIAAERIDSGDPELELWRVDTGRQQLVFLPSVGGRLLSLRVDGVELLWVNPAVFDSSFRVVRPRSEWPVLDGTFASWTNVGGSKAWPAPQGWGGPGEWAGPPDPVLDAGEYSFSAEPLDGHQLLVTMESRADPRTGLAIARRFLLTDDAKSFELGLVYTNTSTEPVRWALWEVAQVVTGTPEGGPFAGAVVDVGGARAADALDLGRYAGDQLVYESDGGAVIPITPGVSKFGFADSDGRLALRGSDRPGLELSADVVPDVEYPDGGSRAEIWMQSPLDAPIAELSGLQPDAWLTELELLSPLHDLGPGETAAMTIHWRIVPPAA